MIYRKIGSDTSTLTPERTTTTTTSGSFPLLPVLPIPLPLDRPGLDVEVDLNNGNVAGPGDGNGDNGDGVGIADNNDGDVGNDDPEIDQEVELQTQSIQTSQTSESYEQTTQELTTESLTTNTNHVLATTPRTPRPAYPTPVPVIPTRSEPSTVPVASTRSAASTVPAIPTRGERSTAHTWTTTAVDEKNSTTLTPTTTPSAIRLNFYKYVDCIVDVVLIGENDHKLKIVTITCIDFSTENYSTFYTEFEIINSIPEFNGTISAESISSEGNF